MATIDGTTGDDLLIGTSDNDVIDGRAGNDQLLGDLGSDVYVFGLGYGHDRIFNAEPEQSPSVDRILLNPGVSPADVDLRVVTQDAQGNAVPPSLLLTLRSSGETLLVYGNYDMSPSGYLNAAIDSIEFADGTVWNWMEIEQRSHQINGTSGDDVLVGGGGDEVIMAGAGNDVLIGGEGRDTLVGESGTDIYVFGYGSGHDVVINNELESEQSVDRIYLAGVAPSDVALSVVTVDHRGMTIPASLLLTLRSTGETLLVREHFESQSGAPTTSAIDFIEFTDGTVWNRSDIQQLAGGGEPVTYITGTPWNDTLWGTSGNDVVDGGSGDDYLWGGEGSDTYVFGHGYGHDRISNTEPYENLAIDRIRLLLGVTPEDVELREVVQDVNGFMLPASLQLRLRSTGETLIVLGSVELNMGNDAIDFIEFADGTVWDRTEIERRAHLFEGTTGDDWLLASEGDDVLDGGTGNDRLLGSQGSDTYMFGYGDGHDYIDNLEGPPGMTSSDRILLKPGVTVDDVELREVTAPIIDWASEYSLQLRLKSTGETITVLANFNPTVWGETAITTIEFADGTVWDKTEIERRAHLFDGTPGDDWLMGTVGNDVLDGGAGNDVLVGDVGSDTYVFGLGSGHDVIHNQEPEGMTSSDRILLKPEVVAADVELRVVTMDANGMGIPPSLQLRLKSTGESVTVMGHFDPNVWGEAAITTIEFADGTVWDQAEIERRTHLFEGTSGDDWLLASEGDDVLDGGAGDDRLLGSQGSDTYLFGYGGGHDYIDNLEGPPGMTSSDRILLKPGVTVDDVELREVTAPINDWASEYSLQLRLKSTGETITVLAHFNPTVWGETAITTIEFADGTVWDQTEIERRAHLFEGTTGDDSILGSGSNDVIKGGDGNDQLQGMGGDDVLDGGAGNDMLLGDQGSDTYLFGQGSGHDYISNYKPIGDPSVDRILLKSGVSANDVELRLVTEDPAGWYMQPSLQLRLRSTGDTLVVFGHFDPNGGGNIGSIDLIEFADGTVWDKAEIERRTHLFEGTAGDDVITATEGNDVLDGGAGNDVLLGNLGSDTYVFGEGYGHDVVHNQEPEGQTSTDRILLKPSITPLGVKLEVVTQDQSGAPIPDSLLLRVLATGETLLVRDHFVLSPNGSQLSAVDSIEFADGTVWDRATIDWRARLIEGTGGDDVLTGTARNDVLDGGAGNDTMKGGLGDDTYVVNRSGDRVVEASGAGTDTVLSSVSHALASNIENLTLTGNAALNGDGNGLNNALFGNDGNNLLNGFGGHDTLYGGSGNDRLDGGSGNDTLAGGLGADVLLGGSGNDVYQFGRGDGADVVQDSGGNADVMSFLSGIEADQLWFRKTGSSLEISVIGTADKVTLSGWYSAYRIEEFKTADGKTLLDNDVHNLVQAMAAFAPPAAGQTTLPQSYAAALSPVIAANWQ